MWQLISIFFIAAANLWCSANAAVDCLSLGFNSDILICNVCDTMQKVTGDNELYVRDNIPKFST